MLQGRPGHREVAQMRLLAYKARYNCYFFSVRSFSWTVLLLDFHIGQVLVVLRKTGHVSIANTPRNTQIQTM